MRQADAMPARSTQVVRDYAEAVFQRARRPLTGADFQVDWADAPSKHTTFPQVPMLPAPRRPATSLGRLPDLLAADPTAAAGPGREWTAGAVCALADLGYGVQERRVAASWNQDLAGQAHYPSATWGRATPSGGGMYPLEIYWVTGTGGPVRPGVYHFHTGHRAWQRLTTGDQTGAVRDACLGAPTAATAGQFLVVTVRFWKNAFKYHNFCYHVVTQDLGALLGSWQLIARGLGRRLAPVLWFADAAVNGPLGLDTDAESALAVVPLPGPPHDGPPAGHGPAGHGPAGHGPAGHGPAGHGPAGHGPAGHGPAGHGPAGHGPAGHGPAPVGEPVRAVRFERSRRVFAPDRLVPVHRATLLTTEARPAPLPVGGEPPDPPGGPGVALPELPGGRWETDLTEALRRRRSSFGRFSRGHRLSTADLGGILGCAAAGLAFPTDLTGPHPPAALHVVVNDVAGVPAGSYHYQPAGHRLRPVRVGPTADPLQRAYALTNYNLEQVAAVLAVSGRLGETLDHYGPRGYRLLNALAGSAIQVSYLAATVLGVGCGAVLGLDNEALDDLLGLTGSGQHTLLFALLGHDRPAPGGLDYPVVPAAGTAHPS
ncbi:nitroreductase family protein [Solwaraspora sp. WMMD1047]|uniref:nitroreductase family protein n=1 Tax=Solwaraspora sp. WMMD1047 TaxID=3016102 RepID=UPI0024177A53|nr:nitroreductase family protein [Solwaraspora sp. WMMD1047]MDG4832112.1 nitroreductase family protein [Solwaraspora sp. WMMD1047]